MSKTILVPVDGSEHSKKALEFAADMIVMGSRGVSDLKGLVMGSVSHKVMQLAPCTCVSVR